MKKKDPDLAKAEVEKKAKETKDLLAVLAEKTKCAPKSVINGSVQDAIAWKVAATKACQLIRSNRPALKTLREVAYQLQRFA